MSLSTRIACIGEAMIEVSGLTTVPGPATIGFAGDTFNTAYYMAHLLRAGPESVAFFTALGQDPFSDGLVEFTGSQGISTAHMPRLRGKLPGLYAIQLDPTGERSFSYWRSISAARSMLQSGGWDLSALDGFGMIYLSGISLAILPPSDRRLLLDKLAALRAAGHHVGFDSNYRPALWEDQATAQRVMADAWACASIALPSADDERALHGDASDQEICDRIKAHGVDEIVLKRGADGPLVFTQDGETAPKVPGVDVLVDTTAAGDSFNAGYLAARVVGQPPSLAAVQGHKIAGQVIGAHGALVPLSALTAR